ncbi:DEAD/H helicase [Rickenella mellea]|uniref:DEAD/H helicase n=1 Tax=Rickenella mellea TaxID=50990 RepID=A0A4Y7QK84_9AGAM|nr:DEAD/H helicase [Rickenella mellea]
MEQGPSVQTKKRKSVQQPPNKESPSGVSKKQRKAAKGKGKVEPEQDKVKLPWPEYFDSLFKIYKALNTVVAFCSSRKHLAVTFPVVRSSVEALLKHPLELSKVAELKALLPDLIKFAYIPHDQLRINAETQAQEASRNMKSRDKSPDYSAFANSGSSQSTAPSTGTEDEHVLVLDFASNEKPKKTFSHDHPYASPPVLSPQAVKTLIEKRNERFILAVNELLHATSAADDPVLLLQSAARDHIPVDPNSPKSAAGEHKPDLSKVPEPKHRPTIESVIATIMLADWYKDQIAHRRIFDAKDGRLGTLEVPLSKTIEQALHDSRNITTLYTHQAVAINALRRGRNVIVSTSTASGKSVIYQVPVLTFLENDKVSTAIYIYPTKALAQDQRNALEQLLCACQGLEHIKVATYDGDTPKEARAGIRDTASVIFTNFDMIHASILPHEDTWRKFLKNLKLVAVDELHYYSNIFGSHVAQIMRRFRRVCAAVGNRRVQFVSCSATISHPRQHMKNIFGVDDIDVITDDGAPSGRKDFLVWNPPLVDEMDPSLGRHSSISEATTLMRFLMKRGVRTIMFCKIRKVCELAMKTLRTDLSSEGRLDVLERVMSYRGGYSPQDRRRIEHEAFSGHLLGIVATNALELGVDIGVLDAVIMLGFPFGIANLRQQAGRAGRRARDALAVMVADTLPLDQHYVDNPNELFDKSVEDLVVDLESKVVLEAHLQCAAFEMPLALEDEKYFGPLFKQICDTRLVKDKEGWYHTNPKYMPFPSKHISIRGIEEERYTIMEMTPSTRPGGVPVILEEIELSRALFEAYEGAVFLHQGLTFIVQEVSHDSKTAKIIRADVNWTTSPRDFTDINAVQTYRIREIKGSPHRAFYGRVEIKTTIYGYFKIRFGDTIQVLPSVDRYMHRRNKAILEAVDLETPPFDRETTGMWIDVPKKILDILRSKGIHAAEAIHSAEHAFLNRFALSADLKTECKIPQKEYMAKDSKRKRPGRLIFYDLAGHNGGIAAKAFDRVSEIMHDSFEAVESCDCADGCPACIRSSTCKEGNLVMSKIGAQIIIRGILGLPINIDAIPDPESPVETPQTIIEADNVRAVDGVEVEYWAS